MSASDQALTFCVYRPELDFFPDVALPVYPRSCGCFCRRKDEREIVPAGEKNFVQIFWTIAGEGEFLIDGVRCRSKSGDVAFRLPLEEHNLRAVSEKWLYRYVSFDGERAADFMRSFGYPARVFHAGNCPEEVFADFESKMKIRTPGCWRMMYVDLCKIIAAMGGMADCGSKEDQIVDAIVNLCCQNYGDPNFNVNFISGQIGAGRGVISRIFRKKMNLTVSEYLAQVRLQEAISLLKTSDCTLLSVARRCGFRDANYFCRFIRRKTGKRPSQLR